MHTKKKKFKPVITRVKLNPEQAVLTCNCYNTSNYYNLGGPYSGAGTKCAGFQQKGTSTTINYQMGSSSS
jgi:hypothetical protein